MVDEDERSVTLMDINPATRGHALVVPRRHARDLLEIEPAHLEATIVAAQRLAWKMPERLGADGVNVLNSCGRAAWQTVLHFHLHLIPRYDGDPLRLPWTPAGGDAEEIAEAAAANAATRISASPDTVPAFGGAPLGPSERFAQRGVQGEVDGN
ncbi:MAG TPA: HIT domain-containing protein, partial [Solirubrobacteraceae bacterium]